jgi:hypothetical protein
MESVLEFIRRELSCRLELPDSDVKLESATVLGDESDTRGVTISLANVHVSAYQGSGLGRPELLDSIEIHLLFSFKSKSYETSLSNLYKTMRLIFNRPTYTVNEAHPQNPFPPHIDKLFFTLVQLEWDELHHLWSLHGGTYLPSCMYSLRIVRKQEH